jgi:uncharacterized membrane protein YjfL (UPF0719 family)
MYTRRMRLGVAAVLGLIMLLLLRLLGKDKAGTPGQIVLAGQVFGCLPIAVQIANECVSETVHPTAWTAVFGVVAFAAYLAAGELGLRKLLGRGVASELSRGNNASAIVAGAHYVAMGLIAARAFAGTDARGLMLSLLFFALAVVTLHLGTIIFRGITEYDDRAQVESGNMAAAVSYAGLTIAMSVLVSAALVGDFEGWTPSLTAYGKALGFALVVWPVRQLVVQSLLLGGSLRLRGGMLDEAIAADRNMGIALLEAASYVGVALVCVSV